MSRVAVVILNYNGRKLLEQFLPSVTSHSGEADIWIADNGSTDDSREYLSVNYPTLKRIDLPENRGFCGGYNYALARIQAEFYVLLNSDVDVTAGWIPPLIDAFDAHSEWMAAQPKIRSFRNKRQFEYAGAAGGYIDQLGYPFCRGRLFDELEDDTGQYDDERTVFWATGACLFIRSSAYHQLGGLNESFFAHMEEIDLCWRIQRSGYRVGYVGSSTVFHLGGATLSQQNPRKTYLNFRNGLYLLLFHLPLAQLMWKLPVRFVLDWVAAARFARSRPQDALAVLRAHAGCLKRLGFLWSTRNAISSRVGSSKAIRDTIFPGILPVEFFLKGKKKFESLGWLNNPK